ncbi:major facilitator superfamily domain-containing protein [Aspergillus californicus]
MVASGTLYSIMTRHSVDVETSSVVPQINDVVVVEGGRSMQPQGTAPYCILPEHEKICLMLLCSFAAIISPISASIYFPALNSLASELHVSVSRINLTVTTYMIFQGLAPSVVASVSDVYGRRPAYLACFIIYLGANIGLALQDSYAALMVLRCLQSSGSSGTIALGSATVADLSTRAERGKYIGYATMGVTLGPALGPVIGGLLDHFLGWRAIFWFLAIFSGVFGFIIFLILPETCRAVVGNGSVPASKWNWSVWQLVASKTRNRQKPQVEPAYETILKGSRRANPIASVMIAMEKEGALILIYGSLLYCGFMSILSTLTSQLQERFGFNSIQVGLCYLPLGVGSLTSRWTVGRLLDVNFRREANRQGLRIESNKQQDIEKFNIEVARLAVTIPIVYMACLFIIGYGWVMEEKTSLAACMVLLFFTGHLTTGSFSALNTLVVDINRASPATAVAANNLFRCLLGAGAVAIANPLIDRIGIGWSATVVAALWLIFSPCLLAVYFWGHSWREEKRVRLMNKKEQKEARRQESATRNFEASPAPEK